MTITAEENLRINALLARWGFKPAPPGVGSDYWYGIFQAAIAINGKEAADNVGDLTKRVIQKLEVARTSVVRDIDAKIEELKGES